MGGMFASAWGGGVGRVTFSEVYLFIFIPFYNWGGVGGGYICLCLRGIVGNIVYTLSFFFQTMLLFIRSRYFRISDSN